MLYVLNEVDGDDVLLLFYLPAFHFQSSPIQPVFFSFPRDGSRAYGVHAACNWTILVQQWHGNG